MSDDVVVNKAATIERCLNLDIVQSIVENHLSDFSDFTKLVLSTDGFRSGE